MKTLLCTFLLFGGTAFTQSVDTIYTFVDEPAEFSGGPSLMKKWFMDHISFPDSLFYTPDELPIGKMRFTLIIEKDGTVSSVEADFGGTPEQEAYFEQLFLITMPQWKPAKIKGEVVRSRYFLPLNICFH